MTNVVIGSLKVSTENLGDHIQILASLRLLRLIGLEPTIFLDRDRELASSPTIDEAPCPIILPLNGWFKHMADDDPQWPPHPRIRPILLGFHIRPFQCPALLQPASIEYLKLHAPIGCRDPFTADLLSGLGVLAYCSHCLTLTFPTRPSGHRDKIVVASRDKEILDLLPQRLRSSCSYVSHYREEHDYNANAVEAARLLRFYRDEAKLVITTFLHCAMPCIAMGIPVVVILPRAESDFMNDNNRERFSGLNGIAPAYEFGDLSQVNWEPVPINIERLRRRIMDDFFGRVKAALQCSNYTATL